MQVFPRYHQLGVVRQTLAHVATNGAGSRYLIQHSAGSGKAKAFVRTYDFLASVIPYTNREWKRLSIVLNLLIAKLPAPQDEDLSKGILESIDRDSYRVEKKAVMKIALADDNAEIDPIPVEGGGGKREPELDRLSNILKAFNDHFDTLFTHAERVSRRIREDIAPKVAADPAYQNARKNTPTPPASSRTRFWRGLQRLDDITEMCCIIRQMPWMPWSHREIDTS